MFTQGLLTKCIKKDRKAWDEFIAKYHSLVLKSVRYKLKNYKIRMPKSEYNDIVQEIFMSLWEHNKLTNVKNVATLKGWLILVSINFTANYCRKVLNSSKDIFSIDLPPLKESPELLLQDMLPDPKYDTSKTLRSIDIKNRIDIEMSKLGYRQQLAIKFNLYDGLKQKDIAAIMNVPENTVATLISRAKRELRDNLKDIHNEI